MAGSLNQVQLIGNLGADPEIRRTQDGRPVANLRMATSESWKDKATGERKEKVEWHRVVIFNEALANVADQYLKKGSKVFVQGQLATRKWTDQQNIERYSTEIVLGPFNSILTLLDKAERPAQQPSDYGTQRTVAAAGGAATASKRPDLDDEIPF